MKKLLVLAAVLLLSAAAATAQPYSDISYKYTGTPHVQNDSEYGKLIYPAGSGMIAMPALLISPDGLFLIKTKDFETFKAGFADDKKAHDEKKASYVSDSYTLNMPQLKTYSRDISPKEIGEGFSVIKIQFKPATFEKAKALAYPQIFTDKKAKEQFEKTFKYQTGSGFALQKALRGYSETSLGYILAGQPKAEYVPGAYTVIYNDYNDQTPVVMLDKSGTFLFKKAAYDGMAKDGYKMRINLDMLGTYYEITDNDKFVSDGKYNILKVNFSAKTQQQANSVNIPRIFFDKNDQADFAAKFGKAPDAALEDFVRKNISSAAFSYLKGTEPKQQPAQNIAKEVKKRNTEGNVENLRQEVGTKAKAAGVR